MKKVRSARLLRLNGSLGWHVEMIMVDGESLIIELEKYNKLITLPIIPPRA